MLAKDQNKKFTSIKCVINPQHNTSKIFIHDECDSSSPDESDN